ncbi:hypothetical protein COPEUT_00058 [Coprococcus eutactus ATCC 27759]|nr:hypothetical protein COPEUT_00058 [Coprococcus eutactus ATCC 27759]
MNIQSNYICVSNLLFYEKGPVCGGCIQACIPRLWIVAPYVNDKYIEGRQKR